MFIRVAFLPANCHIWITVITWILLKGCVYYMTCMPYETKVVYVKAEAFGARSAIHCALTIFVWLCLNLFPVYCGLGF